MAKKTHVITSSKNKKSRGRDDPSSSSSDDSDYEPSSDYETSDELCSDSSEYTECTGSSNSTESEKSEKSLDKKKFKKMLYDLFPSKYSKNKLKEAMEQTSPKNKSKNKKVKKSRRRDSDDSENDEDAWASDASSETLGSEDSEMSSDDEKEQQPERKNIDIVLNIGGGLDDDYNDDGEYREDEDETCDTDDEKAFMKERYEDIVMPAENDEVETPKSKKDKSKKKKKSRKDKKEKEEEDVPQNVDKEYSELVELKKQFVEQLKRHPKNKILKKSIQQCKEDIQKLVKDARNKNAKQYHKLMNAEFTQTNEMEYFKKKMSNQEQLKIMEDFREINANIYTEMPHRLALLRSKIPAKFKAAAMQRLNMLSNMDPSDNEYYKIKNWVDTFMRIPFGLYKSISVSMSDGMDACHAFMHNAKETLDTCVYGMNDAKLQILQMMGQWIVNPSAMGTAIAIHGPPGTGKTSIVKDGISKILGREFAFLPLGGSGDGSFLEGHSYTYEGSTWGKIVQILIDSKCMNPIIYFDELDKLSETARGQEIVGILTHLTDTTQNSQFHDKYFSDIDFDLSKCLFIFSYNDEHAINPILKDRMYHIKTKGYDTKEKIKIARDYLLPKIREQVKFSETEVVITDEVLNYLITTPKFCKGEQGVRNLKRCLEIIHTKLNLFRFITDDNNSSFLKEQMDLKVTFPFTPTTKDVNTLIRIEEYLNPSLLAMYV